MVVRILYSGYSLRRTQSQQRRIMQVMWCTRGHKDIRSTHSDVIITSRVIGRGQATLERVQWIITKEMMSISVVHILLMVRCVVMVEMCVGIWVHVVVGEVHWLLGHAVWWWEVRGLEVRGWGVT